MSLLAAARRCCGEAAARLGDEADAVDGVVPEVVATPRSGEDLASLLAETAPAGAAVLARGSGTKLALGPPPRCLDLVVDTTALNAVVEHAAGDLVVRVQAGLELAELQRVLADQGQWLALDPPEAHATVGGVVASNASGPRRLAFGTARDLLIGATFVLPDGTVARSGGAVVKNVAGYDLCKLLVGSLGTLGVLAELTFRLHPRPPALRAVTHEARSLPAAWHVVQRLLAAPLTPTALELHVEPAEASWTVAALFEGDEDAVRDQAAEAAALTAGTVDPVAPPGLGRRPFGPGDVALKLTHRVSALPAVLAAVERLSDAFGAAVRGASHAGVGVTWVGVTGATDVAALAAALSELRDALLPLGGRAVVAQAPPEIERAIDVWGPVPAAGLAQRVKDQFDPTHRMAPGRFAGGI